MFQRSNFSIIQLIPLPFSSTQGDDSVVYLQSGTIVCTAQNEMVHLHEETEEFQVQS